MQNGGRNWSIFLFEENEAIVTNESINIEPYANSEREQLYWSKSDQYPNAVEANETTIRQWAERIKLRDCENDIWREEMCVVDNSQRGDDKIVVFSSDGLYEGDGVEEVVRSGYGVFTSTCGKTDSGQWKHSQLNGFAFSISEEKLYEGQWLNNLPHGYGAGRIANCLFEGVWTYGFPNGLGRLTEIQSGECNCNLISKKGWFYGNRLIQETIIEFPLIPYAFLLPRELKGCQPASGLYLVGLALERYMEKILRQFLNKLRLNALTKVLEVVEQSRKKSYMALKCANTNGENAIRVYIEKQQKRAFELKLAQNITNFHSKVKSDETRNKKLEVKVDSLQTLSLVAHRSSLTEELDVSSLETEYNNLKMELDNAKKQKELSKFYEGKISKFRQSLERVRTELSHFNKVYHQSNTKICGNTKKQGNKLNDWDRSNWNDLESDTFVCGISGCECKIPKDAFRRIASVLNGE